MNPNTFPILILIGRPASGKSEIIAHLKNTDIKERIDRYHIGEFEEIDDFPMLWTWFEEDAIRVKILHRERIHTDAEGYFLHRYQWDLLIERLSLEYRKKTREEGYHDRFTSIIEFSRGSEHGGYASAFQHLSEEILDHTCLLYIDVSYEESRRKNRRRFNPERPDSILEHSLPDTKLEKLYRDSDWEEISSASPTHLSIRNHLVPYIVFKNEPEITDKPDELGIALETVLGKLWRLKQAGSPGDNSPNP